MAKEGQKVHRATGQGCKTGPGHRKGVMLPRGPRSAYTLFYQCARKQLSEERPELSFREFPTICSQLWRNMPEEERALWQADSVQDRERYERELLDMAAKQTIYSPSVRDVDVDYPPIAPYDRGKSMDMRGNGGGGNGDSQVDIDAQFDPYGLSLRYRSSSSCWPDIGVDFWAPNTRQGEGSITCPSPPSSPSHVSSNRVSSSSSSQFKKRKSTHLIEGDYSPLSEKEYPLHTDLEGTQVCGMSY